MCKSLCSLRYEVYNKLSKKWMKKKRFFLDFQSRKKFIDTLILLYGDRLIIK